MTNDQTDGRRTGSQQTPPPAGMLPASVGTEAADWSPEVKKSVRLRQGDLLHQLNEDVQASTAVHNLARMQRQAYAKKIGLSAEESSMAEKEPDDVRLGDDDNSVHVEHYHAPGSSASTFGKWLPVVGAVILGAGVSAAVGYNALRGGLDTDTKYQLGGEWVERAGD